MCVLVCEKVCVFVQWFVLLMESDFLVVLGVRRFGVQRFLT